MKILQSDLALEYRKEYLRYFFMVSFDFAVPVRYNDTEETVYDGDGNAYLSRGFKFSDIESLGSMAVSQLDIDIDDTDQVMSAILLGEDCRNCDVSLYVGGVIQNNFTGAEWGGSTEWGDLTEWGADYTKTGIVTQEFLRGIVSGWKLSGDNKCEITIKNELVLWSKRASRIHSSTCPWEFRGVECQYVGGNTWCDGSYDRCTTVGNTDNFGGFRFLPSLMTKELWWGRMGGV